MNNYDIAIIGAGVAGSFAALKIAKEYKNMKTILFDLGRPPSKRRRQLEGWLGVLPNSDGKLYLNDVSKVADVVGTRRARAAEKWFNNYTSDIFDLKVVKDKPPSASAERKIKKSGFDLQLNNYMQLYPRDIHNLSRHMSNYVSDCKNITMSFDDEVLKVVKQKGSFTIVSASKEVSCKRIIVCTGRSGWRWTKNLYDWLGVVENNDTARFGIRIEANANVMKDFSKSNCSIISEDLEIGPLCWNGTVIPEDHVDLAISAFRSNENRWKSDKVSFNLIGNRFFENKGFEQTNRIGQLTFVLSNDRVIKERVSSIIGKRSKISIIPEYDWLPDALNTISAFMPDIIARGYFHIPTILPLVPKVKVGNNLAMDVDNMFCAGESAGIPGLLAAATSGLIAADSACR
jgi:uncharacterized FAD-dependent dehydrogenase